MFHTHVKLRINFINGVLIFQFFIFWCLNFSVYSILAFQLLFYSIKYLSFLIFYVLVSQLLFCLVKYMNF